MARNKKQKKELLEYIKSSSESTAKNTKDIKDYLEKIVEETNDTNKKLDDIRSGTKEILISNKSKIPLILTALGVLIAILEFIRGCGITAPQYEIYLYSEYSKVTLYQETNMTATLNFEADSVSITANLASGNTDTLEMSRKNSNEWEKKVIFNETGVHEIVVTAITPNGDVLENSIEVEVVPISFDFLN